MFKLSVNLNVNLQHQNEQLKKIFLEIQSTINHKSVIRIKTIALMNFVFVVEHYQSSGLLPKKGKQYKIKFNPNIEPFKDIVFNFVLKFNDIRIELKMSEICDIIPEFLQFFGSKNKISQLRIIQSKLNSKKQQNIQKQLNKALKTIFIKLHYTQQIIIQQKLSYNQLFQIFSQIKMKEHQIHTKQDIQKNICQSRQKQSTKQLYENQLKYKQSQQCEPQNPKKVYDFHLKEIDYKSIAQFIKQWTHIKCQYCQSICQQKIQSHKNWKLKSTHQDYQASRKLCDQCNQNIPNEVINLIYEKNQIITLNSIQRHGYSIYIRKVLSVQKFVLQIIQTIFQCKFFISCQIQSMPESVTNILEFIFCKYYFHSNYLIKIGHQIQVTSYRLLLNTSGLNEKQIYEIISLMKQPGHYQFICYGDKQYLDSIMELFKIKPFIRFNFYLPISQYEQKTFKLIEKMQKMADKLKQKVYVFAGILNNLSRLSINILQYIFLSLHMKTINQQF